ncbi:hypothetical protein HOY80DRAFT_1053011 [Tuber brumale]|nr:hypothetical protein HOY80DRAFT_1053011 [Tuber brumale]
MKNKKHKVQKWSDYLKLTGLYDQPTEEEDDYTFFEFEGTTLKNIGKNTRHHTREDKDIFTHITIPHFNLPEVVALSQKNQPPEASQPGFKAENEPTLLLIEDQNIFIRDNTGHNNKTGNILAVKVGSMMKSNPTQQDTAISAWVLEAATTGLYRYLATDPRSSDDNNCHKSRTQLDKIFDSEILCEGGPAIAIPENQSCCINIHVRHMEIRDMCTDPR